MVMGAKGGNNCELYVQSLDYELMIDIIIDYTYVCA